MNIVELCEKRHAEGGRTKVSAAFGYFDVKFMAELYGTYGLHIADQLTLIRKAGLRVDWKMLEHELIFTCGMEERSAASMVKEAQEIDRFMTGSTA